jgi:hypothetical protein
MIEDEWRTGVTAESPGELVRLADVVSQFSAVAAWLESLPQRVRQPSFKQFASAICDWDSAGARDAHRALNGPNHDAEDLRGIAAELTRWRSWVEELADTAAGLAANGPRIAPGTYMGDSRDRFLTDRQRDVIPVSDATRSQAWRAVAEWLRERSESAPKISGSASKNLRGWAEQLEAATRSGTASPD